MQFNPLSIHTDLNVFGVIDTGDEQVKLQFLTRVNVFPFSDDPLVLDLFNFSA